MTIIESHVINLKIQFFLPSARRNLFGFVSNPELQKRVPLEIGGTLFIKFLQ
tara:strand:+ start:1619 stop:1774 length:156 start_codon:yes stop_codon:yes gene_type:complete